MGITINYATGSKSVRYGDVLTALDAAEIGEYICDAEEGGAESNTALYRDYNGRGMYAEKCWGIVAQSHGQLFKFIAALAENLMSESFEARGVQPEESAAALAGSAMVDSMGHDVIMYFPGWELAA
jgi:hypothetical protein